MAPPEVVVARTGTANLASVLAGLRRAGAQPVVTMDAARIAEAAVAVLPGVGAFGAALESMRAEEIDLAIAERVVRGRPLLAICLGLQVLCEASEESPGIEGLGVVSGVVRRFGEDLIVPQLGWNRVSPTPDARLLEEGYAYYANSYRLESIPAGWSGALTDHGGPFVAALERGPILACQFHPELSATWGAGLLKRWLEASC